MRPSLLYKDSRAASDTQELVSINGLSLHKSHPVTTHIFPENETSESNRQNFVFSGFSDFTLEWKLSCPSC